MKAESKRDEPLKIPLKFDDAMRRAVQVKPPAEGWKAYEKKLKTSIKRRKVKAK